MGARVLQTLRHRPRRLLDSGENDQVQRAILLEDHREQRIRFERLTGGASGVRLRGEAGVSSSATTLARAEPLSTFARSARSRVSWSLAECCLRGHPRLPRTQML